MRRFNLIYLCLGCLGVTPSFAEVISSGFDFSYLSGDESSVGNSNKSIVAIGTGMHSIDAGDAIGLYLSGITPIADSDFAVYGRGEMIADKYKTGTFWAWNFSVGAGYYINESVASYVSVGKCFSTYSTCFDNKRTPGVESPDIDAIYYGTGLYIKEPLFNNYVEIGYNWSPYKGYNGQAIFIGYGVGF